MIGLLALIPAVEVLRPGTEDVALAIYAPLPKEFGELDREKLAIALRTLGDGSQDYPRRAVFAITDGRTVDAALLPTGVSIRVVVPKAQATTGVSLLVSLARRPNFYKESLDRARISLGRREYSPLTQALRPTLSRVKDLTKAEAQSLMDRVFVPNRTVLAAVGDFPAGTIDAVWKARTADWKPIPAPRYPERSVAPSVPLSRAGVATLELRGKIVRPAEPTFMETWVALTMLGIGKGGSLFRDLRQPLGWTYRQEAILWPEGDGFVPRLIVLTSDPVADRPAQLRPTLLAAVEKWTEADRSRALAMARAHIQAGITEGPLWLGDGPIGTGPYDLALLNAYWQATFGEPWNPARLLSTLNGVTLDAAKTAARQLLTTGDPIVKTAL